MFSYIDVHNCYFFTASIRGWMHLLKHESAKQVIIDSLKFLVKRKRIVLYSFVIMPSHIHLIWDIQPSYNKPDVQRDFLRHTSRRLKRQIINDKEGVLGVGDKTFAMDPKQRLWQRRPWSTKLFTLPVFEQKLNYIHLNPVKGKWKLAPSATDYLYSSAAFYNGQECPWDFLTDIYDVYLGVGKAD